MNGNGLLLRSLTSSLSPCTLKGDRKSTFSTISVQHDHEEEIFWNLFWSPLGVHGPRELVDDPSKTSHGGYFWILKKLQKPKLETMFG